jgi:type IV secretory pathway VirB2 component (pilin)
MRITIQGIVLLAIYALQAYGAATGRLPWETPLATIRESMTGPVGFSLGVIGIGISGAALLKHGDLSEFGMRASLAGLAGSVLCLAPTIMTSVIGVTGGLI